MKAPFLCAAALVALTSTPLYAQVSVSEGELTLPFYQEGPPNPNPPFDQYATTRFNYPYVLRDNLTSNRVERTFRAVYLENEYLKCSVLPDVGGHVYTCIDKINNVPMFYKNPSIKEAAIGMRGGWAAFGLEFNFPVSHNWMTVSPIDYAFSRDEDGSASVTISNVDRVYGMQWTVQLVLHPGSTVLEQRVTLNNRSDVRHRFYWWSNAGVEAWDDTRILYPMRYSAAHGYADVDDWPIDSTGRDLSLLKNHIDGPVSRFVHGSREPFMGIWNPHTNAGIAHYADYAELPAKKIWSWGVDADAMDWRKALSDNNSAYVEVQAGLFRNQETYAFLDPRQTIHFTEYWMPLHELGGLSRANLSGALNLTRSGDALVASLNVNIKIPNGTIRILDGTKVLHTVTQDLAPEHTWSERIPLPLPTHPYTVEISDNQGTILLTQTEGQYDWTPDTQIHIGPQPSIPTPDASHRTEDDWLQLGRDDELNGRTLHASDTYEAALNIFPASQSLTLAAGRLSVALLQYRRGVDRLLAAQARDTPNPEIAYYLGLAYDGLDDQSHARTAYETASRLPTMRAAADLKLGELHARTGDLPIAEQWLRSALHEAPDDLRTAEELSAVLHARGKDTEATALAQDWYSRNPTSYFLAEQLGTPQTAHMAAEPERVLNVAAEYMRLGRYEAALTVLSRRYPAAPVGQVEPGAVAPSANPIVGYYQAFCLQKLGKPYSNEAATASHLSVAYVFPSGAQTFAVLEATLKNNQQDATAQYLLGTLQFSTGMVQQAEEHWQRAHDAKAMLPGLDADRGLARLVLDADPQGALAAFHDGLASDPTNEAVYMGIDQALSTLHRPASDFIAAMDHYPDKPNMRAKLVYELALHHAEAGNFAAAQDLLRNRFFPREEGGTNVRQVWIEIELERLGTLARNGVCTSMEDSIAHLNQPQAGMDFTNDGLDPILATARVRYQVAKLDRTCEHTAAANVLLQKLANDPDLPWAQSAAQSLPNYNPQLWRTRITAALAHTNSASESSYKMYTIGLLQQRLGDTKAAAEAFRHVFLIPDQTLSWHLTRTVYATP